MKLDAREKNLLNNIPNLFKYNNILYIGAKNSRMQCSELLRNNIKNLKLDIVEPFIENYNFLLTLNWINKVYNCTIQDFDIDIKYDIIFWWHGPEHIEKTQLKDTFEKIESLSNKYIILGCPYGKYEQGAVGGNDFEIHRSYLYPEDFSKYGYSVSTLGEKDVRCSHILAWKCK